MSALGLYGIGHCGGAGSRQFKIDLTDPVAFW
jgi:hypothetical protein